MSSSDDLISFITDISSSENITISDAETLSDETLSLLDTSSESDMIEPEEPNKNPINLQRCNYIRIEKELKQLKTTSIDFIKFEYFSDCIFIAVFKGPKNSPYEDQELTLEILLGQSYPFDPPVVRFLTEVIHTNVSPDGYVCFEQWSPSFTIETLVLSIYCLLSGTV